MNCLILTGGLFPRRNTIDGIINPDIVIAADSGLDTAAKLGYECAYLIGDLDSVSGSAAAQFDNNRIIKYAPDKDFTDTELALKLAWDKGADFTVVAGGGGGRLDHLLAVYSLFDRENAPDVWITDNSIVILIKKNYTMKGVHKKVLSFFPVGNKECRARSVGLKWPLDNLKWNKGDFGISNLAITDTVNIEVEQGRIVCIQEISRDFIYE